MKVGVFVGMAVALCAGLLLTGCDKLMQKGAANAKASEANANAQAMALVKGRVPGQPQTVYGSAMGKARSSDCLNNMRNVSQYMMMCGEYLPTSARDLMQNGCPDETLRCPEGGDYEFLVRGRVRNSGKVKVLRCPNHDLVLYSDGSASSGR